MDLICYHLLIWFHYLCRKELTLKEINELNLSSRSITKQYIYIYIYWENDLAIYEPYNTRNSQFSIGHIWWRLDAFLIEISIFRWISEEIHLSEKALMEILSPSEIWRKCVGFLREIPLEFPKRMASKNCWRKLFRQDWTTHIHRKITEAKSHENPLENFSNRLPREFF